MNDDGEQLAWRETYFVLFSVDDRPTLSQVESAIHDANKRLKVENLEANDDGLFTSGLVQAPEDNAAMEVSYESGEMVIEQSAELAKHLQKQIDGDQLAQLVRADARLDIMHFERLPEGHDEFAMEDDGDDELLVEALDPASLITVVEALAQLTGGIAIDPAAGDIMV
jgi:hypothetical protein